MHVGIGFPMSIGKKPGKDISTTVLHDGTHHPKHTLFRTGQDVMCKNLIYAFTNTFHSLNIFAHSLSVFHR